MTDFAPRVIDAYFRAIAGDDTDALVACFTDDAEVSDEGSVHRGPEEIRAWRERTRSAYRYTADVLAPRETAIGTRSPPGCPGTSPAAPWRSRITSHCETD